MLVNKNGDWTPFDMAQSPCHQNALMLALLWGASYLQTRAGGFTAERIGMQGLAPPYLVLSTHQGYMDYFIAPLCLYPHRASYLSDVEGFAAFGKALYRHAGCIAKRRFVPDAAVARNVRRVVKENRDILVVFPESRHSNAGVSSPILPSTGKLAKWLGVPVVVLSTHGSYLSMPFWDEGRRRRCPIKARMEMVFSPQQLQALPAGRIQEVLERKLSYDAYRWQAENHIGISDPFRARGLHQVLYLCPDCGARGATASREAILTCTACGAVWEMDVYGRMQARHGATRFAHIPDWYEYERQCVHGRIEQGAYGLAAPVWVEALANEKGFIPLGDGELRHEEKGFTLQLHAGGESLFFPSKSLFSVQTEYNYRGKGPCIVLSTRTCCYYIYPRAEGFYVTDIQFAAEYFYRQASGALHKEMAAVQ